MSKGDPKVLGPSMVSPAQNANTLVILKGHLYAQALDNLLNKQNTLIYS